MLVIGDNLVTPDNGKKMKRFFLNRHKVVFGLRIWCLLLTHKTTIKRERQPPPTHMYTHTHTERERERTERHI